MAGYDSAIIWIPILSVPIWFIRILQPLMIEDFLYLIPAMSYTTIFLGCIGPYLLRAPPQYIKYRLFGGEMPVLPRLSWNSSLKIITVAGLIILERILYRYAYSFALGLELTLLKVMFRP